MWGPGKISQQVLGSGKVLKPIRGKSGFNALFGPKHTGLGHNNPSPQKCWGICPTPLVVGSTPSALHGHTCAGRTPSALYDTHAGCIGQGYLPKPMFLVCGTGLFTRAHVLQVIFQVFLFLEGLFGSILRDFFESILFKFISNPLSRPYS